jgi:hypothetical protein
MTWVRIRRLTLEAAAAFLVAIVIWWVGYSFVRIAIQHRATSAFLASATWGLVVLAAFAGWGSALNAVLFPRDRADWGLRCAWGWGVAVAIGGTLLALSVARRGALETVVALGLVGLTVSLARDYRAWRRHNVWRWTRSTLSGTAFAIGVASIFSLAAALYLASILNFDFNTSDDTLCYFGFVREMLDRGTLSQVFSFRRESVYGGQELLQAIQLAIPVPDVHMHLLDHGMSLLTVMMLLVGQAKAHRRTSRAVLLLALLFTVTLPEVRANTGSTMSGVVFFLGLYRTLTWPPFQARARLLDGIPVALLAAGACTLRQNYLVPIGMFLFCDYGAPILQGIRLRPWRIDTKPIAHALVTGAMTVILLSPWWAMAQRWSGTFLFPVIAGNYNPDYEFFKPLTLFEELRYVWANVSYCLPIKAVPLFLVAALTAIDRKRSRTLMYFVLAGFIGVAMLIRDCPDVDAPACARYYFGFTFAALLAIAIEVGASPRPRAARGRDAMLAVPLVAMAFALQLYDERERTAKTFDGYLDAIQKEWEHPTTPWTPPEPDPAYEQLQAAVPAGAPIAAMVDQYDRFDLRRNDVQTLDVIGATSPRPGLPLFRSADEVADYLVRLGYRYVIVVHPDVANWLYRRDTWERNQRGTQPLWQRSARFYLRAFDVFDQLRTTRAHVADVGPMTALDLTRRVKLGPP